MSYVHACAAAPAATLPSDDVGSFLRKAALLVEPICVEDGYARVSENGRRASGWIRQPRAGIRAQGQPP